MHWMTFEYLGGNFHCGRPWSAYGIPVRAARLLVDRGPAGVAAPVQNFLNYGNPVHPHDTSGWPKLTAWTPTNLTYEGTYWRWIQRAWKAGLRLMVMSVNENRSCACCRPIAGPCDEMATVRKGIEDIKQLQGYVDAQAGGPGKGFFQIVANPFQARKVINEGKMAVVLEVEVSELIRLHGRRPVELHQAQVDAGLDDLYRRGVRSSLLLNKFDNPLTGVRFDSGPIGVLINAANPPAPGRSGARRPARAASTTTTIDRRRRRSPRGRGAARHLGLPSRQRARLSTRAALQHARAHDLGAHASSG